MFRQGIRRRRCSLSPLIIQKILVRLLSRPFVCAQIEVTGGNKAIVAQDVLDMPEGAAIKEEGRCHSVTQHVRGNRFGKADHFSKAAEPGERRAESEGSTLILDPRGRTTCKNRRGDADAVRISPSKKHFATGCRDQRKAPQGTNQNRQ